MIPKKYNAEIQRNSDPYDDDKMMALIFGKAIPGIYLLIRKGQVVYIGQSKNIAKRIEQHQSKSDMIFEQNFTYINEPDENKRIEIEKELILSIKPEYNICHNR